PFARAAGPSIDEQILHHPVVAALETLLNGKHSGGCRSPSNKNSIRWYCLGAIPPVKEPTILPNSCGFDFDIQCPGEIAEVSGTTVSYFLASPRPNHVKGTDALILINGISFKTSN
ncbi:MAG: hypothetical protein ACXWSD_19250, partial [Bdellovibrionota bacterium]